MHMPHNAAHERAQAETLVEILLDRGYSVSLYDFDGGEWLLKRSTNPAAILAAMGSTDSDTLRIYNGNGGHIATFWLVYGNSPGELVSNHTDNHYAASIMNAFEARHPLL